MILQLGESIKDIENTMQYDMNIPPDPMNCGRVFSCPRMSDGAVSEMYKGTRVTARPIPNPSSSLARRSMYTFGDHNIMRPPMKYRTEDAMSIGRLPMESDRGPENFVMTVAPIRDMATMSPSMVGWPCKWNSLLI